MLQWKRQNRSENKTRTRSRFVAEGEVGNTGPAYPIYRRNAEPAVDRSEDVLSALHGPEKGGDLCVQGSLSGVANRDWSLGQPLAGSYRPDESKEHSRF